MANVNSGNAGLYVNVGEGTRNSAGTQGISGRLR